MTRARLGAVLAAIAVIAAASPRAQEAATVRAYHVQGKVWIVNAGAVNAAVQVGDQGVLVVDTLTAALAAPMLAEIRRIAPGRPIRYIVNTSADADHVGGNATIAAAGESVIGGNFVGQVGQAAASQAEIFAHENVETRMAMPRAGEPPFPFIAMPTDTFIEDEKDLYFNGEGIELLHVPSAHTDGDTMVWFRGSDVLVTGDIYNEVTYPVIRVDEGGTINGVIAGLNQILRITIPADKQEGGTYVIPGHGRYGDEADVFWYRNMITVLRDRLKDAIASGKTLEQTEREHPSRDYDGRYGGASGGWTAADFVSAAWKTLTPPASTATGSAR